MKLKTLIQIIYRSMLVVAIYSIGWTMGHGCVDKEFWKAMALLIAVGYFSLIAYLEYRSKRECKEWRKKQEDGLSEQDTAIS